MNHSVLILALSAALFGAFLLGWLAGWASLRRPPVAPAPAQAPADDPRWLAAQADAAAARAELREASIEIEELRAYIDRRLGPQAD